MPGIEISNIPRSTGPSGNGSYLQQRLEGKRSTSVFNRLRRFFSPRTVQKPKQIDSFTQPVFYSVMGLGDDSHDRLGHRDCGGFSPKHQNLDQKDILSNESLSATEKELQEFQEFYQQYKLDKKNNPKYAEIIQAAYRRHLKQSKT